MSGVTVLLALASLTAEKFPEMLRLRTPLNKRMFITDLSHLCAIHFQAALHSGVETVC